MTDWVGFAIVFAGIVLTVKGGTWRARQDPEFRALRAKVVDKAATAEDRQRLRKIHNQKALPVLVAGGALTVAAYMVRAMGAF